jgi:hypothetical protein
MTYIIIIIVFLLHRIYKYYDDGVSGCNVVVECTRVFSRRP